MNLTENYGTTARRKINTEKKRSFDLEQDTLKAVVSWKRVHTGTQFAWLCNEALRECKHLKPFFKARRPAKDPLASVGLTKDGVRGMLKARAA